jgi:alcohol oxidase
MGHPQEVDVIVAGGGPAGICSNSSSFPRTDVCSVGCVVAGRLAYADPNLKVMLIEGKVFSPRLELPSCDIM